MDHSVSNFSRRELLTSTALALLFISETARSATIKGNLPFVPGANNAPSPVAPGPWRYFTSDEGAAIEALVDRLIPADPQTPGGKDSGCAVYIDRQLAGPYGRFEGMFMSGPFHQGTPQQGQQSSTTPAQLYRRALAALDQHCRGAYNNTPFAQLPDERKSEIITGLENGSLKIAGTDGFFHQLLTDTQQGFFADPIYGGNRDMAAWKMIGFPGARYDYREWVDRHNERFPLPPIGIAQHPNWSE
jgi:gluconate 2-dehydrogenase gamma chain